MAGLHDMAKMTVSGTPGTGTITLGAAITGFQTFAAAGVINQETVSYSIQDGANWEVGRGLYTTSGTSLTRGPLFSSNSNAAISATSAAIVWVSFLAEDLQPAPATGLSAAGNNSQGSALSLTTRENYVTTVTPTANSVKIVAALMIPGTPDIIIFNDAASSTLNVFGDTGVSINSLAVNTSFTIVAGFSGRFRVQSSTVLRTA